MANLKSKLVAIGVVVVLAGMVAVVLFLFTHEAPSPVCDHVEQIRKTDPHEADQFVVALGSGSCRQAMGKIEHSLEDEKLTKVIDCLMAANDARAAQSCLPAR